MNKDIYILHRNDLGIAFMWQKPEEGTTEKVQLIFRDLGFYLTHSELKYFKKCIGHTHAASDVQNCGCMGEDCRSLLLRTPAKQLDIAVSYEELTAIEDLVEGALFRVGLDSYLKDLCKN